MTKERKYNDGGAITFLPSILDTITKNRIRIMNARNMRKACRIYGNCKQISDAEIDTVDQTGAGSQVSFGDGENIDSQTGGNDQVGGNGQIDGDIVGGETNGNTQIPIDTGVSTGQVGGGVPISGGSSSGGTGTVIVHPLQPVNRPWFWSGQQGQVVGAQQGIAVSGGDYGSQYHRHHGHHGHRGPLGAGIQVVGGGQVFDTGYRGLLEHRRAQLERKLAQKIAKLKFALYTNRQPCCQTAPCNPCSD